MNDESWLVMQGSLDDFSLAEVLQVIGMSRQYTRIQLQCADGRECGTIWVKSGRVIGARAGGSDGRAAFVDLFGPGAAVFVVHRLPEPKTYPDPLGSLTTLLVEAVEASTQKRSTSSKVVPLPSPPRRRPSTVKTTPRTGIAVAVTSPKGGVGKTTITLNLAFSLAQRGMKTLVVDADINGDVMSLLAARERVMRGAYDILGSPNELASVIRPTVVPELSILPACGPHVPETAMARRSLTAEWNALLAEARKLATVVLVDCPAGMFDVTSDVLGACTHAVGVVQSELVASRSSSMLMRGIQAIPAERRPRFLGVVVNMFQGRSEASLEAFHAITSDAAPLFETTIPRSDAFAEACLAGVPVRFVQRRGQPPPVSWLFDMLATEVCDRIGVATRGDDRTPGSFVA
jgi:chromosome partitioning protein